MPRFKLVLKDMESENEVSAVLEFFTEDDRTVFTRSCEALFSAMVSIGAVKKREESMKPDEKEEQKQDLNHQKPEETDNLSKSERPADDYLKSRALDPETLGKSK